MKIEIGKNVTLNGKTYKVVGTVKRSWLLEKDGKQFKATSSMMAKILEQNANGIGNTRRERQHRRTWMEKRLQRSLIWNKDAQMPITENELWSALETLVGELSPENLSCDGELSRTQINLKLRAIRGEWKEIEKKLGREVSEYEAEDHWIKELHRNKLIKERR